MRIVSLGGGERGYVKRACESSLTRLGIDVIDLYYLHRPPQTAGLRGAPDRGGAKPAQLALAWVHGQGERLGIPVVPIPGTKCVTWLGAERGRARCHAHAGRIVCARPAWGPGGRDRY